MKRTLAALALSMAGLLGLGACGGSDPLAKDSTAPAAPGQVVVGSADFSESVLLAEIYAGALRAKGIDATTKPRIGSREVYLTALKDGSVQVLPEYTGALALYYDKNFAETDPEKVYAAVQRLVPPGTTVLAKSAAEDKDAVVVTRETAESLGTPSLDALGTKASEITFGGPPEFKTRTQGVPGLQQVYGATFKDFRPLSGQALVQALLNKQVGAANIFTTDPAITQHGLVTLQDPKKLFGAQNIVPLVSGEQAARVRPALDAVSAALTTEKVTAMLEKTDVEKKDHKGVAEEFLKSNGLG